MSFCRADLLSQYIRDKRPYFDAPLCWKRNICKQRKSTQPTLPLFTTKTGQGKFWAKPRFHAPAKCFLFGGEEVKLVSFDWKGPQLVSIQPPKVSIHTKQNSSGNVIIDDWKNYAGKSEIMIFFCKNAKNRLLCLTKLNWLYFCHECCENLNIRTHWGKMSFNIWKGKLPLMISFLTILRVLVGYIDGDEWVSGAGRIGNSSRALETLEFLIRVQSHQAWLALLVIFITRVTKVTTALQRSKNFPVGTILRAKTFRTKCVNLFHNICAKSA